MSPLWCFEFCSTLKPVSLQLVEAIILLFLAICAIGLTRLIKSKKTRKLKLPSNTSSIIITRFKTQKIKEEPFMALGLHYHDDHRDLNDIGAWAHHDGTIETHEFWSYDVLTPLEDNHPDLDGNPTATYH